MFCGFMMLADFELGYLGVVAPNISHGVCLGVCMFWEFRFAVVLWGLFGDYCGIVDLGYLGVLVWVMGEFCLGGFGF